MEKLLEQFSAPGLELNNRMVIAPMTRRRAENKDLSPIKIMETYYEQRASAGLIISEGSQVSPTGYGYTYSPGCYSEKQTEGWKKITEAVHKKDGKIFIQLWHVGPFSHPDLQPDGKLPVAASSVIPEGQVLTQNGHKDYVASRPLTIDEIYQTVEDFGKGAENAKAAGFDGVEIHGAHGYLIDQFIQDSSNLRKDEFGGSIENRSKFLFMVIDRLLKVWPSEKIGLRLSPSVIRIGKGDSNPEKTFGYVVEKLNDYNLSFLHISEMMSPETRRDHPEQSILAFYRNIYKGTLISCGGYERDTAIRAINNNETDLIAFGKPFISNPDLFERFVQNAGLNAYDKSTFYHGAEKGYIDYPIL